MGQFEAGKWLLGLTIYFILFFLIMTSVTNAKTQITGRSDQNIRFTDPGFNARNQFYYNQPICAGGTDLSYGQIHGPLGHVNAYYLDCNQFRSMSECNSFENCNWTNSSFLFIDWEGCNCKSEDTDFGRCLVNLSFYGFPASPEANASSPSYGYYTAYTDEFFCSSNNISSFNSKVLCEQFGCSWVDYRNQNQGTQVNAESKGDSASAWQVFKWIITFQADIGLGDYNWIFFLFFFWLEFAAYLWAIYMAIPFFH